MASVIRDTLNMRIKPEDRNLLDWAARIKGKTRTDFILEAARQAAEEALLDRALIHVDQKTFQAFLERLDAPAIPNEKLKKTMRSKSLWS